MNKIAILVLCFTVAIFSGCDQNKSKDNAGTDEADKQIKWKKWDFSKDKNISTKSINEEKQCAQRKLNQQKLNMQQKEYTKLAWIKKQ